MDKIKSVHARQILDSRGNPTIEVDVVLESGILGRGMVPSGASTGSKEALELRDNDPKNYLGKSVHKACENVNNIIALKLVGMNPCEQKKIDYLMIELDGTENKGKLGANAILGVSMAVARAAALSQKKSLVHYLGEIWGHQSHNSWLMPTPMMNIINGGAHASNNLSIQEFMIVPHLKKSFSENLRSGMEVFHALKTVLKKNSYSTNVGDEGGFAPNLKSHAEAIELILEAISAAGYRPGVDISLALDAAASEFYKDGKYMTKEGSYASEEMVEYYVNLVSKYPIYSIEDGLDEGDHKGWELMTKKLADKILLVGDDLFVTNPKIFKAGIENKEANAILIKVNQIGTLSETIETMKMASENKYRYIVSHRSGETGDSFIADLAVACQSGHIKTGSGSRSDRLEKYNQLLRIEEMFGSNACYTPVK